MTTSQPVLREHGHGDGRVAAAYQASCGKTSLLTAGADGRIKVWSDSGEALRDTDDNEDALYCLAVSPDGAFLAVGDDTKVVVRILARQQPCDKWLPFAHMGRCNVIRVAVCRTARAQADLP
jgi:WD40 repeat protein